MYYYFFFVTFCLCSFASADDAPEMDNILFESNIREENGKYSYRYYTGQSKAAYVKSELRTTSDGKKYIIVQGGYSYVDPNGFLRIVTYVADENGYRPHYSQPIPFSSQEDKDKFQSMFSQKPVVKPPKEKPARPLRPPGGVPGVETEESTSEQSIGDSYHLFLSMLG